MANHPRRERGWGADPAKGFAPEPRQLRGSNAQRPSLGSWVPGLCCLHGMGA
jgi:hypothetical protein